MSQRDFPAAYWDAEGNQHVCHSSKDVHPDWTPHHPSNPPVEIVESQQQAGAAAQSSEDFVDGLTRREIVDALKSRKIAHVKNAKTRDLYKLLLEAVEKET